MQLQTKTRTTSEVVEKTEEYKAYVTSDGKEFKPEHKQEAIKHQQHIDGIEAFKKAIKYKLLEKELIMPSSVYRNGSYEGTFTFEWNEEADAVLKEYGYMWRYVCYLDKIPALQFGKKYIVQEYREENYNGRDYYYSYFNTVDEYMEAINSDVEYAVNTLVHGK